MTNFRVPVICKFTPMVEDEVLYDDAPDPEDEENIFGFKVRIGYDSFNMSVGYSNIYIKRYTIHCSSFFSR